MAGICSFVCEPNYQISEDGTGCVLSPVVPVSSSITQISSVRYTTASCSQGDQVSGIYSLNGVDACGCIYDDGGTDVCGGATSACVSSTTDYFGQASTYSAVCTTCDTDTCLRFVETTVQYDSACGAGTVLYISTTSDNNQFCGGCATLDGIATSGHIACAPVENSYATCTTYETYYGEDEVLAGSCGFACVTRYQSSTDGTSCVLSPTPTPTELAAGDRRKLREMNKRRKIDTIF